ncbi:hypothetical protein L9F63_005798 [Diploptera punctata]|uniref:Bee-milk protein n=1 Tax=Diploptera punctata TaxID=6984 RepID=A0AAD7ZBS8_DIPPU|nr:hypothetical protein L9F63_005798 [Diploptera punctata]
MQVIFYIIYLAIVNTPIFCWDLSSFAPNDSPIGQVVVWRNRAFISLPRYKPGSVKATLIETLWPDNTYYSQISRRKILSQAVTTLNRAYPRGNLTLQKEGHCQSLQNVTALDVDSMRGWLWVIDSGNAICWPKVVVYDLRSNEELWRTDLETLNTTVLISIAADPVVGTCGPRAYVGARNIAFLIVIERNRWWPVYLDVIKLKSELTPDPVVESIVLSRREPLLYLTAPDTDLMFSFNLSAIRSLPCPSKNVVIRQPVSFLGYKLGPSRGLVMDLWSGLHYFLPRDYATVRWDTRRPLSAESHSVLLQSYKRLPEVTNMFVDPQWQVWAVVGHNCIRIQKYSFM